MTRETKIGLLLGLGVILLIGIIISDQLSQVQRNPADFTGFAAETQRSIDASDATPGYTPSYAPVYTPGNTPAVAPGNVPATDNTGNDVPGQFFIPDDIQNSMQPRQADAGSNTTPPVDSNEPLAAFNVSQEQSNTAIRVDNVPTLTLGSQTPVQPAYTQTQPATRVDSQAPGIIPASADASVIRHTVQASENLMKIARRYYGNDEYWRAIALANPDKVTPDGGVQVGTVLDIPKRDDAVLGLDIASVGQERPIPVDARTATSRPQYIEVQPGDTLSELASKHLGTATKWQELLEANKNQLDSPESLRVGMKLRLPSDSNSVQPTTPQVASTSTSRAARSGSTYTVKPGDNLTQIAVKTLGDGGKWRLVYEANRDKLKSPDRLIVGQELRIPG